MQREYLSLRVSNVDWLEDGGDPERPIVTIAVGDADAPVREKLTGLDGAFLDAGDVDVSFRLQGDVDDTDATGVVALTNRLTGDYVFELNAAASEVLTFVDAARRYGERTGANDGSQYRVRIEADDEPVVTYDKRTFLVYSREGELLRGRSLIPSGVEI